MKLVRACEPQFSEHLERYYSEHDLYPLHSRLSRKFYSHYWSSFQFENLSFAVDMGTAFCAVFLSAKKNGDICKELSFYGLPIAFVESLSMDSEKRARAEKEIRKELNRLIDESRPERLVYEEHSKVGILSPVGVVLLEAGCRPELAFTQVIDLLQAEDVLRRQIRKSFRSGISWGLKNLDLMVLDQSNVKASHLEDFRVLHIRVAERETRSQDTWNDQYEMIQSGEAFAVFGYLDSVLVTAAFFLYSTALCYYGVSASDRSLFGKPISHAVIWTAIMHARKLGCRTFEMGGQFYAGQSCDGVSPSEKEMNIAKFKRGFGGETLTRLRILQ
jgi:hypothetical protein